MFRHTALKTKHVSAVILPKSQNQTNNTKEASLSSDVEHGQDYKSSYNSDLQPDNKTDSQNQGDLPEGKGKKNIKLHE